MGEWERADVNEAVLNGTRCGEERNGLRRRRREHVEDRSGALGVERRVGFYEEVDESGGGAPREKRAVENVWLGEIGCTCVG